MSWAEILDHIAGRRYANANDVRDIFADYHDALHWLATFLIGEELARTCVIDAGTIAERQEPLFHEWLAHWAARATLRSALQKQWEQVVELGPTYERFERVHARRSLLSPHELQLFVAESGDLAARLDVLCRFVLVMHGVAKESFEAVAVQLGVSPIAVERAYCVAFDTLHLIAAKAPYGAEIAPEATAAIGA